RAAMAVDTTAPRRAQHEMWEARLSSGHAQSPRQTRVLRSAWTGTPSDREPANPGNRNIKPPCPAGNRGAAPIRQNAVSGGRGNRGPEDAVASVAEPTFNPRKSGG